MRSEERAAHREATAAPGRAGKVTHAVNVFRDVTDTWRAKREAQLAVRAREEVLAMVSHDLRSPLANAIMRSDIATRWVERTGCDEKIIRDIGAIQKSLSRTQRLIDDLPDAAAIDSGTLAVNVEHVLANEIVRNAVESVQVGAASRQTRITTDGLSSDVRVAADRERLVQVLGHLLGNAIKFTPEGGHVQVQTRVVGSHAWCEVTDNGLAIASKDIGRVFDRLWRARAHHEVGLGLGLHIARGLVRAHGGESFVESEPGKGTTFRFSIPLAKN